MGFLGILEAFIVIVVIVFVYKIAKAVVEKKDKDYGSDETELIQDIHRGLSRMEQRIESLETILLDRVSPNEHAKHED